MRERCPLFTNAEAIQRLHRGRLTKGYWIVEGFASMVEEFRLDPVTGNWEAENPIARRRDLLAGTTEDQRIPWQRLFDLDVKGFYELDQDRDRDVATTVYLGPPRATSEMNLFYAQAATVSHYLFNADEGRHRPALLEYLASYYRGDEADLDVEQAFGIDADTLGERTLEYARGLAAHEGF